MSSVAFMKKVIAPPQKVTVDLEKMAVAVLKWWLVARRCRFETAVEPQKMAVKLEEMTAAVVKAHWYLQRRTHNYQTIPSL